MTDKETIQQLVKDIVRLKKEIEILKDRVHSVEVNKMSVPLEFITPNTHSRPYDPTF